MSTRDPLPDAVVALLACVADRIDLGAPPPGEALAADADVSGTFVVRFGGTVVKIHSSHADPASLGRRLRLAADLPEVFLAPSVPAPLLVLDRLLTLWPYAMPVDGDRPADVPWESAGRLLARVHTAPLPVPGPRPLRQGMPAAVADALARMAALGAAARRAVAITDDVVAAVRSAAAGLPPWATDRGAAPASGRPDALTHGDWHLGQLVRRGPDWRLIDVDALGAGDPAWDLARPAMWLLAGVIPPAAWDAFLGFYLAAGGTAVPRDDPWSVLEPLARAAAVQAAASAVARAGRNEEPLDDVGWAFVAACRRIADTAGHDHTARLG